jgi:hypothetical protein
MLRDFDFIKDNIELMSIDDQGTFHCLLVVGEDRPDGILIESEGYGYARYASFMPNAADFLAVHPEQEQTEKEQQTASTLKLKDLIRIPLEDIHLVHSDEDIELATIVELKSNTLTDARQKLAVDGNILLGGMLFSLLMGCVGGLLPALSAMRLKPLDSVR